MSKYTDPANKRDVAFWALLILSAQTASYGAKGTTVFLFLVASALLVAELRDRK